MNAGELIATWTLAIGPSGLNIPGRWRVPWWPIRPWGGGRGKRGGDHLFYGQFDEFPLVRAHHRLVCAALG